MRRLVDALTDHLEITVICPADNSPRPLQSSPGVNIVPFAYGPMRWQLLAQSPGGVLPSIRAMPGLLLMLPMFVASMAWTLLRQSRQAELVHANWAICGAVAGVLQILHRKPIVVTLRGDDVSAAERSILHRCVLALAVSQASAVICVAESMAIHLRKRIPSAANKIVVALNGVGSEFARSQTAGNCASNDSRIRVICIGSLIRRKGVDVLIRAIAQLQRDDVVLQVVGDGAERAKLQALAGELGIAQQVTFVGQQQPDEIPALLASSDIFVMPSHSEGRPNSLLEAMAVGIAIVATRIPGIIETAKDGQHAWLTEAGDATSLSFALADAIEHPLERQRRGAAACAEVHARGWTWSATADIYAQVFTRALSP